MLQTTRVEMNRWPRKLTPQAQTKLVIIHPERPTKSLLCWRQTFIANTQNICRVNLIWTKWMHLCVLYRQDISHGAHAVGIASHWFIFLANNFTLNQFFAVLRFPRTCYSWNLRNFTILLQSRSDTFLILIKHVFDWPAKLQSAVLDG